ncbi:Ig-like domain-containing protein, partial [Arenibacter palladensis]|uniref:Ig-like domain-containing protein n=1 Tax=Arenibacter palladensis TaxID=237373 RepID=UPI0026E2FED1
MITNSGFGQTRVFANGIISQSNTDNSANAIDTDLSTKASIRAKDFPGSYSGALELEFPSLIPAETTAYVKIDAEDPILEPLLAGGLGDFLGAVVVSKQEFSVQVKNVNTVVLQGDSNDAGEFGTSRMRLVMNEAGEYFIVVTPDQAFNRIRIINRIDQGGISIGEKTLGVFGAFFNTSEIIGDCGSPSFTSYDGSSSGLLGVGGAGVHDPENAIDDDNNTFSELNLGMIGIGSSIEQILYFEELSYSNEVFKFNLKLNSGLLALGVLDNIEILGYNGADLVASESLTDLLNLDLLGLFQNDENAEVPFAPGAPIDRIVIRFSSFISVALPVQKLEIHEVKKVPGPPTFDASSQDVDICKGESASLIAVADPNDLELRWYDSAVDGTLLGTVASGTPFVTSPILADTTFYVAAAEVGCPEESERTPVEVTVVPSPEATDIMVTGNESSICSSNTVTLVPSSALTGTFNWYLDANKNNPITDGMVDSGITYNIDANDELTITGLSGLNSPYTYYVSITDSSTGCENMDGELKSVVVTIQDNSLAPTITLDSNITADDIVNSNEAIGLVNITGVVGGDAQVNDVVTLTINNVSYQGNVAADLSFSIPVNGSDLIADADTTIDASVETTNGICTNTGSDTESFTVDTTAPNPPTVNTLLTNDTTPTITGTADSADVLTVTLDGTTYTEGDGNLTDNGDGTWTLTVPAGSELAEGTYDVAATTADLAGNTANDLTTDELTIDLTDPTPPTVNTLLTNDTTPTITGTADSADV